MADQLNLLDNDRILPTALHQEMQRSYLEYAMSVIVGRALPDVRDGLKPVQRRILYAMHELGLTPDRPYRKCARVVGDVLGKYHPHGDQSVYDALVRQVQDFNSRYPLIAGHGNFGSIDDDPPAAMRYTETRLSAMGNEAMLGEIGEETVDFTANFDNSQQEPVVLPAQLPFLLLNGCTGIAVGMATNVPPHNLGEIVDGLIALIDRPDLTDESLLKLIPGPDFPTGATIIATQGIRDAALNGRGSITMRGVATIGETQPSKGRHRRPMIIITELPFQVNKAAWIEKVADLVNNGKLDGIADLRDESDRDGIRVVIELKREANPTQVLHSLYQKTALQCNFGAIFLAIVDGQPRQLTLKELLQEFLQFRETTLTRRYSHELSQQQNRLEIVDGILKALGDLDRLIDILRNAPDGSTARAQLQVHFDLSERQADAILSMPLRRLTGTERQTLETEQTALRAKIVDLERILGDRNELLKSIKKDLRSLKKKFDTPRRTRILSGDIVAVEAQDVAEAIADNSATDEPTVLELSHKGYIRRISVKTFQRQTSELQAELQEAEDSTSQTLYAKPSQSLISITKTGTAYGFGVGELPVTKRTLRGSPIITLLPQKLHSDLDSLATTLLLPEDLDESDLILTTTQGRIKRLPLADFTNLTARGLTLTKLKDDDQIAFATLASIGQSIVLCTSGGRLLRFPLTDAQLPQSARNNQGTTGIRMRSTERIVGCVAVNPTDTLLLASEKGYMKRLPANLMPQGNRGDIGNSAFKFALQKDQLCSLQALPSQHEVVVITNQNRSARLAGGDIPVFNKDGAGARVIQVQRDESIVAITVQPTQLG
jgi:DNA gyrase subunit A